jgi:hypothetical protein
VPIVDPSQDFIKKSKVDTAREYEYSEREEEEKLV